MKKKSPGDLAKVFPCVKVIENLEDNGHRAKIQVLSEHVWKLDTIKL